MKKRPNSKSTPSDPNTLILERQRKRAARLLLKRRREKSHQ
jgi:hypothetical protein